jgi:polar amino acid transport system substrate-binding protein
MKHWHRLGMLALAGLPLAALGETYSCVSFEYPPLIHQAAGGPPQGLAVEIVDRVFRKLGDTMQIRIFPWARALAMVGQGNADCIFTLYHAPERELFLDYSNEALVPQIIYFYARKGVLVEFDGDMASIKGFSVGTAHQINYGPKFEQARPRLNIDEAPTIEQNFMKLARGRVDLVPSNLYTASSTLALASMKDYADRIVKLPVPVESVMSYIAFSKARKLTTLRDRFDVELRKFVLSDEYHRLLQRYNIDIPPERERMAQSMQPK